MLSNFKLFVFLLVFIIITNNSISQEYSFEKITINQGLSQNSVYCILKDSKGFMWFGTEDGLNKFDGYSYKIYNTEKNNKNSINSNYAYSLCEISPGTFLVGTEKSISLFETEYDRFINIKFANFGYVSVSKIIADVKGNIWIGTFGKGLLLFENGKNQMSNLKNGSYDRQFLDKELINDLVYDIDGSIWIATLHGLAKINIKSKTQEFDSNPILINKKITSLYIEKINNLWIGTENGLYLYTKDKKKLNPFSFITNSKSNGLKTIKSISLDKKNRLWVGTDDGIVILNPDRYKFSICTNSIYNPEGLSQNTIQVIYTDNEGTVWIGTEAGGVNIYNEKSRKFNTIKPNSNRNNWLNHKVIYGFNEDKNGLIYIATYGGGLNIFDTRQLTFRIINAIPGKTGALQSNYIYCTATGKDGLIWIGTRDAGLQSYNPETDIFKQYKNNPSDTNTLSHNAVKSLYIDSKNRIWIGTYGGGLNLLDSKTGKIKRFSNISPADNKAKDNVVYSIYQDKSGVLWVGTRGGGLKSWDEKTGNFESFVNSPNDTTSISNNFAFPIMEDSKGRFWIGTLGGGLNLFDRQNLKFHSVTTENGLSNNVIYSIIEDNKGTLWMSTAKGLTTYNPDTKITKSYFESDGLQSSEFNGGAGFKSKKGFVFFGGINGFSYFHPDSIFVNSTIPPVYITGLSILNKEIKPTNGSFLEKNIQDTKQINIDYFDNILTFEFTALNFTHSDMNQYACKMEGFDNQWNQLGNRRVVNYTNLDPGIYTFKVIASNNDGIWNTKGSELKIVIEPPFYKTLWFRMLLVIIIVLAIIFTIRRREYKLKSEKIKLEIAVRERTKEIEAQKEEITAQRDQIEEKSEYLSKAYDIIENKNKSIMDSIIYAQRIQKAIFPPEIVVTRLLNDAFILLKPKDFVSGDFYWLFKKNNLVYFAAVDCTGHGVPGAFISLIGYDIMTHSLKEKNIYKPADILNKINNELYKTLKRDKEELNLKEGMDMALCCLDKEAKTLQYSGAVNPLYFIRDNELIKYGGDKRSIGTKFTDNFKSYTNHEIQLKDGDIFYIFSDGYYDQFGGEKRKKYQTNRFKEFLLSIHKNPLNIQKDMLIKEFERWKGNYEQLDDILIIGVKV